MKKVEFKVISKSGMSKVLGGGVEPLKNDATTVVVPKHYEPIKRQ